MANSKKDLIRMITELNANIVFELKNNEYDNLVSLVDFTEDYIEAYWKIESLEDMTNPKLRILLNTLRSNSKGGVKSLSSWNTVRKLM